MEANNCQFASLITEKAQKSKRKEKKVCSDDLYVLKDLKNDVAIGRWPLFQEKTLIANRVGVYSNLITHEKISYEEEGLICMKHRIMFGRGWQAPDKCLLPSCSGVRKPRNNTGSKSYELIKAQFPKFLKTEVYRGIIQLQPLQTKLQRKHKNTTQKKYNQRLN